MSLPQFKAFLHRTRERFRDLVRQEVMETIHDPNEVDLEIGELIRILAS
jgi:hypothetical protein